MIKEFENLGQKGTYSEIAFVAILSLFFLELITKIVANLYAPCLSVEGLNAAALIPLLLIVVAPLISYIVGKVTGERVPIRLLQVSIYIVVIARLLYPLFEEPSVKLSLATFGVTFFLITLPGYLAIAGDAQTKSRNISLGFVLAILGAIFLKSLGSTVDISMYGWTQAIGWILGIICIYTAFNIGKAGVKSEVEAEEKYAFWKVLVCLLGGTGIFILAYFGLASPGVITSWIGGNYTLITSLLALSIGAYAIIAVLNPAIIAKINYGFLWVGNLIFLICFGISVAICDNMEYHLLQTITMYIALALSFFVMVDFTMLLRHLFRMKPKVSKLSLSFIASGLVLIIFMLIAIFTITWNYVKPISTPFKDMYPEVLIALSLLAVLPAAIASKPKSVFKRRLG